MIFSYAMFRDLAVLLCFNGEDPGKIPWVWSDCKLSPASAFTRCHFDAVKILLLCNVLRRLSVAFAFAFVQPRSHVLDYGHVIV